MSVKLDDYIDYIVCTKCYTFYNKIFQKCIIDTHGQQESERCCCFIQFPNHPYPNRHKGCNEMLMKMVIIGKKYTFVPRKVFIYHSIVSSLKEMAKRKGFLERCDHWRI